MNILPLLIWMQDSKDVTNGELSKILDGYDFEVERYAQFRIAYERENRIELKLIGKKKEELCSD